MPAIRMLYRFMTPSPSPRCADVRSHPGLGRRDGLRLDLLLLLDALQIGLGFVGDDLHEPVAILFHLARVVHTLRRRDRVFDIARGVRLDVRWADLAGD